MEGFKKYLRLNGASKSSIESRVNIVSLYLDWLKKEAIEAEMAQYPDILLYMKYLQQRGLTQKTIQHYLGAISHYYDYLQLEKRISGTPIHTIKVKGIRRRKLYHLLEPHELNSLYQNYPCNGTRLNRDKVMVGLLCYQGLTTRELSNLEVKDVDLKAGTIYIEGSRRSNGRTLELVPHQVMQLHEYIHEVRPELLKMAPYKAASILADRHYLIISEGGRSRHFDNLLSFLAGELKGLNPKFTSYRQIRASVITKWLKQHNKRKAQYLAGHRFISSTEHYEQQDVEELKFEIEQFHPMG